MPRYYRRYRRGPRPGVFRGFAPHTAYARREGFSTDIIPLTGAQTAREGNIELIQGPTNAAFMQQIRRLSINISVRAVNTDSSKYSHGFMRCGILVSHDGTTAQAQFREDSTPGVARKMIPWDNRFPCTGHFWFPRGFRLSRFNPVDSTQTGLYLAMTTWGINGDLTGNVVWEVNWSYMQYAPQQQGVTLLDMVDGASPEDLRALKGLLADVHPEDCDCNSCQLEQIMTREVETDK